MESVTIFSLYDQTKGVRCPLFLIKNLCLQNSPPTFSVGLIALLYALFITKKIFFFEEAIIFINQNFPI